MESVIIEFVLGCTNETIEFMLPAHVPLATLVQDIVLLIEQTKPTVSFGKNDIVLYDLEQQTIMHADWTLAQNGVHDGSKLMIL